MLFTSAGRHSASCAIPPLPGRAVDAGHTRRLAQLPDQGVLASATADDENFHNSGQTRLGIGDGDVKLPAIGFRQVGEYNRTR